MSEGPSTSYDDLPYESRPLFYTHPDWVGPRAMLFGMRPPAADGCRVLELGCAGGGNLVPMALSLPRAKFVGIDLSRRQIATGQALVDELKLTNIDLRAASILDVDDGYGEFDYILCHGVYSWVPPEVQDKILTICRRNLAPSGVAYISYNVYPGWHVRGMIREMMSYHVRQFDGPQEKVEQARAFLHFLVQSNQGLGTVYGRLLQEEEELLQGQADYYLYHEHLEDLNQPVYFHQFAERAACHGLQFLAEARFFPTSTTHLPEEVKEAMRRLSNDVIRKEQYFDFLRNRTFRQTLLCNADVPLRRQVAPESMTAFQFSTRLRPESAQPDVLSGASERFSTTDGLALATDEPPTKAALVCLAEAWPGIVSFEELLGRVRQRLNQAPGRPAEPAEGRALAETLLRCYLANLVDLHLTGPRYTLEVSERPVASALARLQAAANARITSLRHRQVAVSDFDSTVLPFLDGSRDRAQIRDSLIELGGADGFALQENGQPVRDPTRLRQILGEWLEPSLQRLAASGLLVG